MKSLLESKSLSSLEAFFGMSFQRISRDETPAVEAENMASPNF